MKAINRLRVFLVVAAVSMVAFVGNALAAPGDPPTFSVDTLEAPINDYGTALLAGLVILIGLVLVIRVPFSLVNLAMRTVKRLFGNAKPSAG